MGSRKWFAIALAFVLMATGWFAFWGAEVVVHHRPAVIAAAKLGTLEWKEDGWAWALIATSPVAFLAILWACGLGQTQAPNRLWRRGVTTAAIVLAFAPAAAYLALVGWSAAYANGHEFGRVMPGGLVRYPWTTASALQIACRVQGRDQPKHGEITFKVSFPDGQGEDFSFWFAKADPGRMLDWDLWIAYQIRKAHYDDPKHHPKPEITNDPDCGWYIKTVTPPDIQAKFSQLLMPAAP